MTSRTLTDRMKMATHFSRKHLQAWIARAERAFADLDRKERVEACECRWCFYGVGARLAGQAFTHRDCESCGTNVTYSTTASNPLCIECARKLGLCVVCCADIDLVDRRKLERAKPPRKVRVRGEHKD